jgi:C_GCAxxG_C_C family probable redox protein
MNQHSKDDPNRQQGEASQAAAERFCNGCNCSQAVLTAFSQRYGLEPAMAMRLSTGLGGGVGRMGGTCGTLTGAALVLGLEYGPSQPGDAAAKDRTYRETQRLQRRFIERHGSNQCKELLGHDLSDEEAYQQARAEGLFKSRCPGYVQTAVDLLEEIIQP